MDNIKNLLSDRKNEISLSLDSLMYEVKRIVNEKNNKINLLSIKPKNKIILFYDIKFLIDLKENNLLLKKILNNFIKIKNQNKKLKKTVIQNDKKNIIDTKNMSAFKIVALELEEKEKLIKEKDDVINKSELEISQLNKKIIELEENNYNQKQNVELLNKKNKELEDINKKQLFSINNLEGILNKKNNDINDLKTYFMEIINKYNDILIEVK